MEEKLEPIAVKMVVKFPFDKLEKLSVAEPFNAFMHYCEDEKIEIKVGVDNVVDAIENINYLRELIKNKNINKED